MSMEYPGTKLTLPIRRGLLIGFIVAFFVLAPAVVMYAAGYRYDWKNGLLKETGAISVDIVPKNAALYLNDTLINQKMPVRLKNITPQKYRIRISAPGYFDWNKEVEVKSKQTVYVKEISLIKKSEPVLLTPGKITTLTLSTDGAYLAYTISTDAGTEVRLRELNANTDTLLFKWPRDTAVKFLWAEKNNFLAVAGGASPFDRLFTINAAEPAKQINVIARAGGAVDKFSWKETAEPELFFGAKKQIMSVKPLTGNMYKITKNTYADWAMEQGRVWTAQKVSDKTKITEDTLGFAREFAVLEQPGDWQLLSAQNGVVVLKNKSSANIALVTADKQFVFAGENYRISRYGDWRLFWTPWELTTYSVGEEPYLTNRSGEGLRAVIPLDRFNTLLLTWNNHATVLFPYYLVNHDLINSSLAAADADSEKRILYFSAELDGRAGLWTLNY